MDKLLEENGGAQIRMLEVGCGICINMVNLLDRYGDKIELTGSDISGDRIQAAKAHFGEKLAPTEWGVGSIIEGLDYADEYFDIVYSMFCLEQIAYETRAAVCEMHRLAKRYVTMIEPVFENGNMVQRLYIINHDYCRILLKAVIEEGFKVVSNQVLDLQTIPSNQSTLLVLEK